jgi:ferredoxin
MAYTIDASLCTACGACELECPNSAISVHDTVYAIDATKCTECQGHFDSPRCAQVCPINDTCLPAPG